MCVYIYVNAILRLTLTLFFLSFSISETPKITLSNKEGLIYLTSGSAITIICKAEYGTFIAVQWLWYNTNNDENAADCGKGPTCPLTVVAENISDSIQYSCIADHEKLGRFSKNVTVVSLSK